MQTQLLPIITTHTGERREHKRFRTDIEASIIAMIDNNVSYVLNTPVNVKCINLSKGGIRLISEKYTLAINDEVKMILQNIENNKVVTVIVINVVDRELYSEYGCKFTDIANS